jgi:type II secretory pathway predicted ATPase ExeA/septal ring-binding cell division protein DamX
MKDAEQTSEAPVPFQEPFNTAHFFTGAGRGTILNSLQEALTDNTELVTLVGDEGSGKTMLCKMLQEQWDTTHKIVLMPSIVESFEEVARVAAQECNVEYPVDANRADAKKIFLDLVDSLQKKGMNLLLICDEAENMYLATLERIRKILDDVNAQGGGLQLLLAGRKSLGANLEQLALCDFNPIVEREFSLPAFDDEDVWSYLNFSVQTLGGGEEKEVFTKEAAVKIAAMSEGNLRMINKYAGKSLESSSAESSFLVLLGHVKDGGADNGLVGSRSGSFPKQPFFSKYVLGGGFLLFLVLIIFLVRDEKPEKVKVEQKDVTPVFTNPPKQIVKVVEKPVEIQKEREIKTKGNTVELVVVNLAKQEPAIEPVTAQEVKVVTKPENPEKSTPVKSEAKSPVRRTPVDISPVEIVEKKTVDPKLPELIKQSKISVDKKKRTLDPRITMSKEKKIPVKKEPPPVKKVPASKESQDPVLGRFIVAGEKWQAGDADSSFSIQLMSLKSEQAETNLKRIISQPEYQAVADKLVVLKRPSDPPVILVFYGEYPSMAAARNGRNNMPIFLRDRHPYPVSVRGAVEKARAE